MAQPAYIIVDAAILHVAMTELERVDAVTVEHFLSRTPGVLLVEMSKEKTGVVAWPSRLLMEFFVDCEELGLMN